MTNENKAVDENRKSLEVEVAYLEQLAIASRDQYLLAISKKVVESVG